MRHPVVGLFLLCLSGLIQHTVLQLLGPVFLNLQTDGYDGNLKDRLTRIGVFENTAKDTYLGTLRCKDQDGGSITRYWVTVENTVKVDETSGNVTLIAELDRENTVVNQNNESLFRHIVFNCKDNDNLEISVPVSLTVLDRNDNKPVYENSPYRTVVKESANVNDVVFDGVSVTDRDLSRNADVKVTCHVLPTDQKTLQACDTFKIEEFEHRASGDYKYKISLKKKVDYEQIKTYTMSLYAIDQALPGKQTTASINVLIDVEDAQDSSPVFTRSIYNIFVKEDTKVDTVLPYSVSARDGDSGNPRPLKFIISEDARNLFRLGLPVSSSGTAGEYSASIIVNNTIDREVLKGSYSFIVRAIELLNGQETQDVGEAVVQVTVTDINDNVPTFSQSIYNVNLRELDKDFNVNQVPDLKIEITDKDDPSNAQYQLVIAQQHEAFRIYPNQIEGDGTVNLLIKNAAFLDYDNPNYRVQTVILEAREIKTLPPLRTSTATVSIFLQDLNDNGPTFTQKSYSATLREDAKPGSFVQTVKANDIDSGDNGKVIYSLRGAGSDVFSINATSGVVTLAKGLDYEFKKVHPIFVVARDQGDPPREQSRQLTISVTNYNDLGPVFDLTTYQTYALETNKTLSPEVIVHARDPEDAGSAVRYSIVDGNTKDQAFQVDPITGRLTLRKKIDYDDTLNRRGYFEIIIQASDSGDPPQTTNTTVTVNVQDQNNHNPIFRPQSYIANISETASAGTPVKRVTATDSDFGENGRVRYAIQSGSREDFDIGSSSGIITVGSRSRFDFEAYQHYELTIYAVDYGSPPKTGSAKVIIDLTDSNNKPPKFPEEVYSVSVEESARVGKEILRLSATDPDSTQDLQYSIPLNTMSASNPKGQAVSSAAFDYRNAFVINSKNGSITTNMNLSREAAAEITFSVRVQDLKGENLQTTTTSIFVTILGGNVSNIEFQYPWTPLSPQYFFSIGEGNRMGEQVIDLVARDSACRDCALRYVKDEKTDSRNFFKVDEKTGLVTLSAVLDYEDRTSRRLRVGIKAIATDGRSASATLLVEVMDDNDNSPKFTRGSYEYYVSESRKFPYRLGYIVARDDDSSSFAKIEYSLVGQGARPFHIYQSGMLIVKDGAVLDYEKDQVYDFLVVAKDNPNTETSKVRKQTQVPVKVNILDENDNRPKFTSPEYTFYALESYGIGTSVGTVTANDVDTNRNAEVLYSLVKNDDALFKIAPSGILRTDKSLRRKSAFGPFKVSVRAADRGVPSMSSFVSVTIHVRSGQLDDGTPYWSSPILGKPVSINERDDPPIFIVQAVATARTENSSVAYAFLKNDNGEHAFFNIDPDTGRITSKGKFDRETKPTYKLLLMATDKRNTSLVSYRQLIVNIADDNDNLPGFDNCKGTKLSVPIEVFIFENIQVDSEVYQVKACDPDLPPYNGVTYQEELTTPICAKEMQNNYFRVTNTGKIFSKRKLDRETKPYYLVCVKAISTSTRRKRHTYDVKEMTNTSFIAYVVITLRDRNDNGPVFRNRAVIEAIMTDPISRTVIRVNAVDPDLPPFNRVRYFIHDIIRVEPNYGQYSLKGVFTINSDTGVVSTALASYSPYKMQGSYFEVKIRAEDFQNSALNDSMSLLIYVFERTQILRVVLNEPPETGRLKVDDMLKKMNEANVKAVVKLQQVSYHRVVDDFDNTKTDVCFVIVSDQQVNGIVDGTNLLNNKVEYVDVLKEYGATSPGACHRARTSLDKIDWAPLWWVLVFIAIFIFVCCVILICAVIILYRNYKSRKSYMVPQ